MSIDLDLSYFSSLFLDSDMGGGLGGLTSVSLDGVSRELACHSPGPVVTCLDTGEHLY